MQHSPLPDAGHRLEREPDELHTSKFYDEVTQNLPLSNRSNDFVLLFNGGADALRPVTRNNNIRLVQWGDSQDSRASLPDTYQRRGGVGRQHKAEIDESVIEKFFAFDGTEA